MYSCCSTAPHSIPHVQQEHFCLYRYPSHSHFETHRELAMTQLSIPCFLFLQNLWDVINVNERLERLKLQVKTVQCPGNFLMLVILFFSPKKSQYSTETISSSLHVVCGQYEASHICSNCQRAIEEDSAVEDMVEVRVAAQNNVLKKNRCIT